MKKIISLVLSLAVVLSIIAMPGVASATTVTTDSIAYDFFDFSSLDKDNGGQIDFSSDVYMKDYNPSLASGGTGWNGTWTTGSSKASTAGVTTNNRIIKTLEVNGEKKHFIMVGGTSDAAVLRRYFTPEIFESSTGTYYFDFTMAKNSNPVSAAGEQSAGWIKIGQGPSTDRIKIGMEGFKAGEHPSGNTELGEAYYPVLYVDSENPVYGTTPLSAGNTLYKFSLEIKFDQTEGGKEKFTLRVAPYNSSVFDAEAESISLEYDYPDQIGQIAYICTAQKTFMNTIYSDFHIHKKAEALAEDVFTVNEDDAEKVSASFTKDNRYSPKKDATLFLAIYDGTKLVSVKKSAKNAINGDSIDALTAELPKSESGLTVKAFVWDNRLVPLAVNK